jgi:LmbE family N-acetylglucosaminyl deacetylase
VAYCLVTSGESGSDHLDIGSAELAELRQKEQTAAAAEVGVTDLTFLGHPDGAVEATLELRREIASVIRRFRPDVVITQSPERNYDRIFASHPDHLATGEAALCAVYPDARNPRAFPDLRAAGLEPHVVHEVWLSAHGGATRWIDVTETYERKLAALRAHESQTGHRDDLDQLLRTWLAHNAEQAGLPEGRLAEAYRVVPTA